MEPSESDSTAKSSVSSNKDTEFSSQCEPSSPSPHQDHDPEGSDLNHLAEDEELRGELQNKLDLKVGREEEEKEEGGGTVKKDSEFNDGDAQVCDDGVGAEESGKVEGCDEEDNRGWNGNESNDWSENEGENDEVGRDVDGIEGDDEMVKNENGISIGTQQYPLRPEAEDCAFYLKTGTCKFGFNCKFNHPFRRKTNQAGERGEPAEKLGQTECKYYLRSGGCKYGEACKYNHTREKCPTVPALELNFLGLPVRQGEKECPYYMRTGSCKFGANCKFNHPEPKDVGGFDPPSGYGNGRSISLQVVSQPSVPSWSSTRTLNEASPFVPLMLPPTQGVSLHSTDWNGYQAPVYLPERSMHSTYVINNPVIESNVYMHHHKPMPVEEFPERPGEPECSYFLKTGDCKFKSICKFHHPKNRIVRLPPCNLSDKGLPLRPDKNVCSHYSRYGICKFGPACKFDHPINMPPSTMPELDQQSCTNTASVDVESGGASDVAIQ